MVGILAASALVAAGVSAFMPLQQAETQQIQFPGYIAESTILEGLAAGAVFPFIDTTPNRVLVAHVALTDSTAACDGNDANQPSNIGILAGVAGVALSGVTLENTGIGSAIQCVFHATITPGGLGLSSITDIVVVNVGGSPLTGANTVTVSATVIA